MIRLMVGLVVGWLAARWYYQPEVGPAGGGMMGRQPRTFEERAKNVVHETANVAQQAAQEAKAAAGIEQGNLKEKAERIQEAGQ